MMQRPEEEEAGERLWEYISGLKRPEETEITDAVARRACAEEPPTLLPLAVSVYETQQAETGGAEGQEQARARLMEAILAEPRSPVRAEPPPTWFERLRRRHPRASMFAALLLLLLAALALWAAYSAGREPGCGSQEATPKSSSAPASRIAMTPVKVLSASGSRAAQPSRAAMGCAGRQHDSH